MILGIMKYGDAGGICFRKIGADLKTAFLISFYGRLTCWAFQGFWEINLSPLKLTYKPTGQVILFRGVDDPSKSKSIKLKKGYFKYIWFEEADQFSGMAEIRKNSAIHYARRQRTARVFYIQSSAKHNKLD